MPEFQGQHAAQEAWKAEVMSRRIALEEIDTILAEAGRPGRLPTAAIS